MSTKDPSSSPLWSQLSIPLSGPTHTLTGEFHSLIHWCLFSLPAPIPNVSCLSDSEEVTLRPLASSCRMHSHNRATALIYALAHRQKELLSCLYFPSFSWWKRLHALWMLNNSSSTHPGETWDWMVFKYFVIILNSPLQGKGLRSSGIVEGQLLSSWHGDIFNSYQG